MIGDRRLDQDTTSKQVSTLVGLKIKSKRLPTWFTNFLQTHFNRFLGFTQFNDTYSQLPEQENQRLSKVALDRMNIKLIHSGEPLSSIPLSGPQIFVANHPHGLVDGFALDHLIASQRPDTKIMAMYALGNIPEYEETLILVDPMKKRSRQSLNVGSWRKVYKQVSSGGALVVFPAGAVSRYQPSHNRVKDSDWSPHIAAIARRTGATVIPLFIHGRNDLAVNGGVKVCHWGGAKVGQFV